MNVPLERAGGRTLGEGRFEIERELGAGGMGVVYAAWDRERSMRVAIKMLPEITPDRLVQFKAEFRSLRDVHHANLVELGELFNDGDRWFFTMELVDGVDFLSWVRPAGELDAKRLGGALAQLCVGIDVIHSLGKVHRDVKPSNVLVTPEGRVVVLDFGLVVDERAFLAAPNNAGTLGYIPPERAMGGAAGPPGDWFAVGVVLHQALAGRHPFSMAPGETNVTAELPSNAAADVLRLGEAVAGGPLAELGALCLEMLQADPDRRPSSEAILRAVGARARGARTRRLIGREHELAELGAAYARACAGSFAAVVVHGVSGLGKSALVEHFVGRLESRQPRPLVLAGRCSARESIPFKAIDEAVDALAQDLRSLPAAARRELLPADASLLARGFPSLADLVEPSPAPDAEAEEPGARRDAMFGALRALLGTLAARQPIILVTEDVQWADADSHAALRAVLESRPPLLFICTVRTRDDEAPALPEWLEELPRMGLGGLAPAHGEALAASLLDGDANVDRRAVAGAIARDTEGLPIFIDLLTSWARERHAYERGGLDEALAARIDALPEPARRLLGAVGLAGGPIALGVAASAAALEGETLSRHAVALQSANLVRATGVRPGDPIEIFHDRVRVSLLSCLNTTENRDGHQRLATALEASGGAPLESLSLHWRRAGDARRSADYAVRAAEEASAALAFDRAARLFRLALRLHPFDAVTSQRLRERRADALAFAGRKRAAALAYRDAAAHAGRESVARLRRRSGEEHLKAGHIDDGMEALRDALATCGIDPPRTPGRAALSIAWRILRLRLRGIGFRERSEAEIAPDSLELLDLCQEMGRYMAFADPAFGVWLNLRVLPVALDAGEPRRIALALASVTSFMSALDASNARAGERWWRVVRELAERIDQPYVHGVVALAGGLIDFHNARFAGTLAQTARAGEMFRAHGAETVWEIDFTRGYRFSAMLRMGQAGAMIREVSELLQDPARRDNIYGQHLLQHWPADMAWLYADDPERARTQAVTSVAWFRANSRHNPFMDWLDVMLHAYIDLYCGEGAAGLARLKDAWAPLKAARIFSFPMALIDALDLRGRCALAAAAAGAADREALLRGVDRDAAAIRRQRWQWALPIADLLAGSAAAGRGDRARALASLERAASGFERTSMALHAAAARLRHGQILGGAAGDEICARANADMLAAGVVAPPRIAAMLAPGNFHS